MGKVTLDKNRLKLLEIFKPVLKGNYDIYCDRIVMGLSITELSLKYNISIACATSRLYNARQSIKHYIEYTNKVKAYLDFLPKI